MIGGESRRRSEKGQHCPHGRAKTYRHVRGRVDFREFFKEPRLLLWVKSEICEGECQGMARRLMACERHDKSVAVGHVSRSFKQVLGTHPTSSSSVKPPLPPLSSLSSFILADTNALNRSSLAEYSPFLISSRRV